MRDGLIKSLMDIGYTVSRSSFRNNEAFGRAIYATVYTMLGLLKGGYRSVGAGTIHGRRNHFMCSVVSVGCTNTLTAVRVKAAISVRGRLIVVKDGNEMAVPGS